MELIGKKITGVKMLPTIQSAQKQTKDQKIETVVLEFEDGSKLQIEPGEYTTRSDSNGESYHLDIQMK
jgi:hypothetical protein